MVAEVAAATARHFRDGWFQPGDAASIASNGELSVYGRADDVMNMNGIKIAQKGEQPKGGPATVAPSRDSIVIDEDFKVVEPGSEVVGRIAAIVGHMPVMRFTLVTKNGDNYEVKQPWDTAASRLVSFEEPSRFSF